MILTSVSVTADYSTSRSALLVCVCVCVCVRDGITGCQHYKILLTKRFNRPQNHQCVCVCVCVCQSIRATVVHTSRSFRTSRCAIFLRVCSISKRSYSRALSSPRICTYPMTMILVLHNRTIEHHSTFLSVSSNTVSARSLLCDSSNNLYCNC